MIGAADRILSVTQPASTVVDDTPGVGSVEVARTVARGMVADQPTRPALAAVEAAVPPGTRWERVSVAGLDGAARERAQGMSPAPVVALGVRR